MTPTLGDGVSLGHPSPLVNPKEGATTDAIRNGERRHHIIKLRTYIWKNVKKKRETKKQSTHRVNNCRRLPLYEHQRLEYKHCQLGNHFHPDIRVH